MDLVVDQFCHQYYLNLMVRKEASHLERAVAISSHPLASATF